MKVERLGLGNVCLIESSRYDDERGFFTRLYCAEEFEAEGFDLTAAQTSHSFNRLKGTMRGMHWQASPAEEVKLVHVIQGRIFDVVVDIRAHSPTKNSWKSVCLEAGGAGLLIPKGFAHGFLTLEDNTSLLYHIGTPYDSSLVRGARWDDPSFGIEWPFKPSIIATKDNDWPDF